MPLLKHIYEETHPTVRRKVEFDNQMEDDAEKVIRLSGEEVSLP